MQKYFLIALGGALGSMARYWVGSTIANRMGTKFPYGTFVINITACAIIGFSLTFLARRVELNPAWRFLVPVGFIGAYSTFSTYEWETLSTIRTGALFNGRSLCSQQPHSRARRGVGWLCNCGDHFMRTHRQLVVYQSILQVLQESGCPFCRFLKEFQAARLQNHPKESIHRLCNFHAWGLAAVQNAPAAAQVFIKLVDEHDRAFQSRLRMRHLQRGYRRRGTAPPRICQLPRAK